MGLGKWGIIGIILYLCRNIISNILYILFWGLVAKFFLEKSGWHNSSQTKD